jgi:hypothetical protein
MTTTKLAVAGAHLTVLFLVVGVLAMTVAGCSRFDAALGQRQAIVSFKSGTSTAERMAIRAACAKTPNVSAQPLPDLKKYPYALEQLHYTISKASDAQVAQLEKCLQSFPSFAGVELQDSSDQGG